MKRNDCQKIRQILIDSLDDRAEVRATALELLIKMRIQDPKIEDTIIRTFREGDEKLLLLHAMSRARYASPLAISLARGLLTQEDCCGILAAMKLVGELKDRESIPLLIQVARERDLSNDDIEKLVRTIGEIGEPDVNAIDFLCLMSRSEDFGIKVSAAAALARLGFNAEAIPYLQDLMRTDNVSQRIQVACELVDLERQDLAYPVLIEILENYSRYFYLPEINRVVWCSRYLQAYKDTVVPPLRKIAQGGKFSNTRKIAFDSLASIGANDEDTINVYRNALCDSDYSIQIQALKALICFGKATPEDVKSLDLPQEKYAWRELSQELRGIDRERFSSEIAQAIVNLLSRYYPGAYIDAQRLLFHLGVVQEGVLNRLVSEISESPYWVKEDILRALSDLWFAVGCHTSQYVKR